MKIKKIINLLVIGVFLLHLSFAENNISELDKLNECDWVCTNFYGILNNCFLFIILCYNY